MYDPGYTTYAGHGGAGDPALKHKLEGARDKATRRRKVLVVDDQQLVADTVRDVLQHAGFEVCAVYGPWEALEIVREFQPDFLLSDVLMPQMNGVEMAIAMQGMWPAMRIVLFSGQAGVSEILEDAERRGYSFELLAKPLHPSRLIEALREH